ncbi:hypothetical protein B0I35DRAFT_480649 [Stachybotrys elegans]|uniref:BZIP domain-containing protein n=1 Tax=Stachybotrys elegans TaxID=80388 RepID=A0A8K0WNV5_9HYPO|nr:hypothetical protein B0I35DRAFT_480649 [Stachybotrys elegans]
MDPRVAFIPLLILRFRHNSAARILTAKLLQDILACIHQTMALLDPVGTAEEERKQRKKLQNRLNQRARRLRLKEQNAMTDNAPVNFEVLRWRLDEADSGAHAARRKLDGDRSPHAGTSTSLGVFHEGLSLCRLVDEVENHIDSIILNSRRHLGQAYGSPGPLADQLFHLVQFNALRGLLENKQSLRDAAHFVTPGEAPYEPARPFLQLVYPGESALLETSNRLPASLRPTKLQMTKAHSSWIHLFPSPRMRDNLIRWEAHFDHAEFAQDVIGNLMDLSHFPKLQVGNAPLVTNWRINYPQEDEGEETAASRRNGLVLWGQAHVIDDWEVTPGFLRKWGWVLEGCHDMMEATNRWRMRRGEQPLYLELWPVGPSGNSSQARVSEV